MDVWTAHSLELQTCLQLSCGPVDVWVQRERQEWLISKRYADFDQQHNQAYEHAAEVKTTTAPEDIDWERWAANIDEKSLRFVPCLPDHPIVARPQNPLHIPPAHACTIYIRIPLWLRIETGSTKKPCVLTEIPCVDSSKTWFGTPEKGELCYSLQTLARTHLNDIPRDPHRALSKVVITNNSNDEMLHFERLCIRAPHLTLYRAQDHFWTNDVTMQFKGANSDSDVRYSDKAPDVDGIGKEVCKARVQGKDGLIPLQFSDLASWVQIR